MNIVIIGGVAAGSKAAAKIKRLLPNSNVTIYTKDTHVSYSSCGLPYYIQGNFSDYHTLIVRTPEEFKNSGINVYLEHNVTKIIPAQKEILVERKDKSFYVPYDKLIIATGARPVIPKISGITDMENIYTLRNLEDGINIREKMENSKSAVIIGGGYIGMEILESFVKNDIYTTVIEQNNKIMSVFDDDMSDYIYNNLKLSTYKNFEIITGQVVKEISTENNRKKLVLSDGKTIYTDFAVICASVKPNIEIVQDAGITIGETGAVKVDKLMRTSIEDIYACGDCAEKTHIVSGKKVWIPLGSTANKEGRCAALNAAGLYCEFEGVLGSTVSRCLNTTMSMTGLTEKQALNLGYKPASAVVFKTDKVAFMPGVDNIVVKVVADKVTGLLLGGQAIGGVGADKRINALTSALLGHLTVQEFYSNDLTYSPLYSPTIDPLLNAMQYLCNKISSGC